MAKKSTMPAHEIDEEAADNLSCSSCYGSETEVTKDSSGGHHQQVQEIKDVKNMAKKETIRMKFWKLVVCLTIAATAAAITTSTYWYLARDQEAAYKQSYKELAQSISYSAQFHSKALFVAMKSAALAVSGAAIAANATFPYVTVPTFEILGQTTRAQSGIEFLLFTPLVDDTTRSHWEQYSDNNQWWIEESRNLALASGEGTVFSSDYSTEPIKPYLFEYDLENFEIEPTTKPPYFPIWQMSPPPFDPAHIINFNRASKPFFESHLSSVLGSGEGTMSPVFNAKVLSNWAIKEHDHDDYHAKFVKSSEGTDMTAFDRPHCGFMQPVYRDLYDPTSGIVATMQAGVPWDSYMSNLLPEGVSGINIVLSNTCDQSFTYSLDGNKAVYVGEGDLHDKRYDDMHMAIDFGLYADATKVVPGHCMYTFNLYPREEFYNTHHNSAIAARTTGIVGFSFVLMILTFFVYDRLVQNRNHKVVGAAARSNAILSSLFPKKVRDQLVAEREQQEKKAGAKNRLKSFLNDNDDRTGSSGDICSSKPIADLFPDTTIMFADLAGFTAWSSTRDPSQVFTLLETLYNVFDSVAKRRHVYKVETIGDCYVAVTGLPEPRKDHAVAMIRFARDCMRKMQEVTSELETTLGPGTAELEMRVGIHSGPVTAGVLRGERSRFQLFGDTMNTASRMESTGVRGKIQVSGKTAELLIIEGKSGWVTPREELTIAKGKGKLQTYWATLSGNHPSAGGGSSTDHRTSSMGSDNKLFMSREPTVADTEALSKTKRLVSWNVDVLKTLLQNIQARRNATAETGRTPTRGRRGGVEKQPSFRSIQRTVLEEVQEIIALPTFDRKAAKTEVGIDSIELAKVVVKELEDYISTIACMYNDTPFHNFDHASYVTASVVKLLGRIVAPYLLDDVNIHDGKDFESTLHDTTYGITSDPLTQFACVFSALVHDVGHTGVPNSQLIKENETLSTFYKNKSVAEQNSVDVAWYLLLGKKYSNLRAAIYQSDEEKKRFRQLVVNCVMATDITDKELKQLRNARWEKAFADDASQDDCRPKSAVVDRKATIVIEHLMQASDVAHAIQHWHVYIKWNQRLFEEMYRAYLEGRAGADPSENWYEAEIGFFDFQIIPLAKKLKDCGVFGVSSDAFLNYATANREEWKAKGKRIVQAMKARHCNPEVAVQTDDETSWSEESLSTLSA